MHASYFLALTLTMLHYCGTMEMYRTAGLPTTHRSIWDHPTSSIDFQGFFYQYQLSGWVPTQ